MKQNLYNMKKINDMSIMEERYISAYSLVFWKGLYLISKYTNTARHSHDIDEAFIIRVVRTGNKSAHYDYFFDISKKHQSIRSTPGLIPNVDSYIIASHDNRALAENLKDDYFNEIMPFIKEFPKTKLASLLEFCTQEDYFEEATILYSLLQERN